MKVAVIGASDNPERYSHQAMLLLRQTGHIAYPVHPAAATVAGVPAYVSVTRIPERIDTATIYLAPRNQEKLGDDLINGKLARVIFNPGTENPELEARLREAGIEVREACTLVLLKTGQF